MDPDVRRNRVAWETASEKHVREHRDLLAQARTGSSLFPAERDLLGPLLRASPMVVHPQSGNGLDDLDLARAGARSVVGVDFSVTAATAAQRRADELGVACHYVAGTVPGVPLRDGCADLVYTGKGALIWMPDLAAWACDLARLLRPGGHLFIRGTSGGSTVDMGRGRAAHPSGSQLLRTVVHQRRLPRQRRPRVAVDARRDRHGSRLGRVRGTPAERVPGAVLAVRRCRRGGVARPAAERVRVAGPTLGIPRERAAQISPCAASSGNPRVDAINIIRPE
jgi:SAM-dependent methyltransferase